MRDSDVRILSEGVLLVTGGLGFIGSTFIKYLLKNTQVTIVNVDKQGYASSLSSLGKYLHHTNHHLQVADLANKDDVFDIVGKYSPNAVTHFAAESHVDNSISGPDAFIQSNIVGTFNLLEACRKHCLGKNDFVFHHISTDEVYGALDNDGCFSETSCYQPNSPYSASKAASDHLVRAWHQTYGLPAIITHCSNNYGPYQYPEKLIPVCILAAINGENIPVYGDGSNIRDWLHVYDHVDALWTVLRHGSAGELYDIGGGDECSNIDLVRKICLILDELIPKNTGSYTEQITFVADRLGHDYRYAIDSTKIRTELGWSPSTPFDYGLKETIRWYLDNPTWISDALGVS